MVIKGTSCRDGSRLATHLTRTDSNETVRVHELRGVAAEDLRGALLEMEAVAAGTRATKPFYHSSINTGVDERLTDEQRAQAIDRLEAALGLTGQARAVVIHEKKGREHCHIVWSRIDLEKMRAISDSHNFRKHEEVARALEREFGHARVQGAHIEREGKERPKRTPSHAEMLQAERTGMSPKEAKEQITEIWRRTDNGPDFAKALWDAGYVLARGDRRDFVVIDPKGGTHSLARRVEGATAKDIRARLAGLDPKWFPNVADAKQIQRNRQERDAARGRDTPREPSRELPRPAPQAYQGRSKGTPEGPSAPARIADGPGRVAASFLDGIANAIERGLSGAGEAQSDHKRDAPAPEPDPQQMQQEASVNTQHEAAKQRRHDLLREFGREIAHEHEADIERGRERERRGE